MLVFSQTVIIFFFHENSSYYKAEGVKTMLQDIHKLNNLIWNETLPILEFKGRGNRQKLK